ncbi:amino acid adenylation domain-containing protein, partial [Candidatus Marithioploca araucensis]|nr:amino acid adenylation domain-containing protein [Candidatus Marithioploca araucensis]
LGNQVLPKSDILFNYLGQFDQGIEADLFQSANEITANDMSLKGSREYLIDINGAVIQNRLSLTWSYSSDCYQEKTIQKLAQSYKTYLQQLIQHCQKGKQGVTVSDFPLVSLSQTTLDTLYQQYKLEDIYPLSPMQQGLLFHALYESETGVYFEQLQFTLNNLDPVAYKAAWQLQLERHPILRSVFVTEQNQMLQIVPTHAPLLWKEHDWQEYSATRQQEQLAQLLEDEREQGFDLTQAPLMRFDLIHLEQQRYIFIQHSHHIITDGWCMPITLSEVRDSYLAFKRGQTPQLPRLRPYRDYIAWLQQQDDGVAQEYWRQCLSGFHEPTTLAIFEHETEQPDYQERQYEIDSHNTQQLQQFQKNQRVTLNTIIQATWALLLSRYSQTTDVCFGVTVSGRNVPLAGIEQMMGLLINTLPLRIDTHPDILVKDYLQQVQTQHQDNNHHAHKALFEIQNLSEIPNGISLFDTLLAFESYPLGDAFEQVDDSYEIGNMSAIEYTNYPLTLMVVPGETLLFRMVYDSNRIDQDKLDRLWGHFNNLLNAITKHPEHTISSLAMLTEAEYHQLQTWNDTAAPTTENTLLDLFEQQARRTPNNIALICEDEQLTYQQVNQSANQLANYLLECHLPLKPLIAVVLERSMQMIISVLAVLKAGGTYIPIDPDYPAERIQRTLETSGAVCLLTHQYVQEKLSLADSLKVVYPNKVEINAYSKQNIGLAQHPDDIAYIIFTSGSTGMPKGVVITHRSAVNTIEDINERFEVTAYDRVLALSSLSFDLSVYDVFGLLAVGGAMVIPPNQFAKEPSYWVEMVNRHKITLWNTVPALMQIYTDYIDEKTEISATALRLVMMSGDWIPLTLPKRIHALYPHAKLISLGGATEASIWSIYYPIENVEPHWKSIPYGKPLRNQSFHILDASLEPCPLFVPGHLYIGGIGLAQEYWRDTEKTQASFITHPRTGKRLYKTGDLGRYLADGNIEFIGRDDFQVKIRGFRIELGDIEAAISKHPEVQDVTVIVQEEEQNNQRLLAYFVPQSPNNSDSDTTENDSQVAQWQEVFEGIYKQEDSTDIDVEFNITGWNSSYTGLPISKAEMKIWLDDTIEKILAVSPQRVLEIGF